MGFNSEQASFFFLDCVQKYIFKTQIEVSLQRAMLSRVKTQQFRDVAIPISESIDFNITECPKKKTRFADSLVNVGIGA